MSKIPNLIIKLDDINNLRISTDKDENNNECAVLLYTPNMKRTQTHYHIELKDHEIVKLRAWIMTYCKNKGI